MKRNLLLSTLGGVVLAGLFSASASAQTCASPAAWQPSPAGDPILSGTTCGNETGIAAACQDAFGAPSAAFVAQVNVAAEGTFTDIDFTGGAGRSEEHTSELQSRLHLVCRLLLEKKNWRQRRSQTAPTPLTTA